MNRISEFMRSADIDMVELASVIGVDVLEIAMAIKGIGLTHLDVLFSMAELFDCGVDDLYPSISDSFSLIGFEGENYEEEFIKRTFDDPESLVRAGIDPDIERWYAVIKLKSGHERRYRMSSGEMVGLSENLANADMSGNMLTFLGDCRSVLIKKSSIYEVKFKNSISYASFSSTESALQVTAFSPSATRPIEIDAVPDGDDEETSPWANMVASVREKGEIPQFVQLVDEDGDTRFLSLSDMELIEIPVSLIMPTLYEGVDEFESDDANNLEDMVPLGEA